MSTRIVPKIIAHPGYDLVFVTAAANIPELSYSEPMVDQWQVTAHYFKEENLSFGPIEQYWARHLLQDHRIVFESSYLKNNNSYSYNSMEIFGFREVAAA